MNVKQSASVIWLIHSLEVLVVGAVFTVVITVYQAFQAGNFDLSKVGVTVGGLLIAFLGNGLKGIVYNASFAQGIEDLFNELFHRQQPAQPPVVINNHPPVAPAAPAQPAPVVQLPFPATTSASTPAAIRTTLNVPTVTPQ